VCSRSVCVFVNMCIHVYVLQGGATGCFVNRVSIFYCYLYMCCRGARAHTVRVLAPANVSKARGLIRTPPAPLVRGCICNIERHMFVCVSVFVMYIGTHKPMVCVCLYTSQTHVATCCYE
jgi:hypothetical protein